MSPTILIEFLRADGGALRLSDLGGDCLSKLGVALVHAQRPFRVEAEPKQSKAGNVYFDYQQGSLPLPDGFRTRLVVGGVELAFAPERVSKAGNPVREGKSVVTVDGRPYDATAFLTKGRDGFWVSVHAHKAPGRRSTDDGRVIKGGRLA